MICGGTIKAIEDKSFISCFQVPINETNTQFVEQTIAIMKNLLDNHTEGSSEHLGQASIETMMLNLVRSVLPVVSRSLILIHYQ